MRVVLQRVLRAGVRVDGAPVAAIGEGYLLLAAIARDDTAADLDWMARKIAALRLWPDAEGRFQFAITTPRRVLVVSQFTLYGDVRRGNRPGFDQAAPPDAARALYALFVERLRAAGLEVETGAFQAQMEVDLVNDGPVTLILDSPAKCGH